jgi:hypothetical protein
MPDTIVILQSNYIPWKGYFDLMNAADLFVIYDEVQFTRRDWRNRNKIIINGKPSWLTIPVQTKGEYLTAIRDVKVSDHGWAEKHWTSIRLAYGKAPFFTTYAALLAEAYAEAGRLTHLSDINALFLARLAPLLGVTTPLAASESIARQATGRSERLIEICRAFGGKTYISGPAAKAYIDPKQFADAGLTLFWADYSGYPTYPQASDTFEHGVSVIDLLMRVGPNARYHLKSTKDWILSSRGLMSDVSAQQRQATSSHDPGNDICYD